MLLPMSWLPRWFSGKESTRDQGLIPGSGQSPGGGYGNPLQCFCLKNPLKRGAWQKESDMIEHVPVC